MRQDGKDLHTTHIDLSHILEKIECRLEDIVRIYRIVCNEQKTLAPWEAAKCDAVVKGLGFDKKWQTYYRNSR